MEELTVSAGSREEEAAAAGSEQKWQLLGGVTSSAPDRGCCDAARTGKEEKRGSRGWGRWRRAIGRLRGGRGCVVRPEIARWARLCRAAGHRAEGKEEAVGCNGRRGGRGERGCGRRTLRADWGGRARPGEHCTRPGELCARTGNAAHGRGKAARGREETLARIGKKISAARMGKKIPAADGEETLARTRKSRVGKKVCSAEGIGEEG